MKRKQWRYGISLAFIGVTVGLFWRWKVDINYYHSLRSQASQVKKWTADTKGLQPKAKSLAEITSVFSHSSIDSSIIFDSKDHIQTFVIPGLRGGWSINPSNNKAAFSDNWVPQGISQSKHNYYISAYDGNKKLNSVIYQIDKKTKQYNKTIILPSKSHVGGIVYDRKKNRLFYSNDVKGKGGLGYISKKQIDAYQASKDKKPICATYIEWALGRRTSAITLYQHQLIIAKYGKRKSERSIVAVPLHSNDLPYPIQKEKVNEMALLSKAKTTDDFLKYLIKEKVINSEHPGWNRLQGITIASTGLTILSQSNGQKYSKIWFKMPNNHGWSKLNYTPLKGENYITLPHSVEEISLDEKNTSLAVIFESGARKYREKGMFMWRPSMMDRVVLLPMDKLSFGIADR